jgi:hypothetical protein
MIEEQDMGRVREQAQLDRDEQCWAEWVGGMRQVDIAAKRGITHGAVSQAIRRYLDSRPEPEREAFRERQMERYERLYRAHAQAGEERPRVAAIVRGIIDSEVRVLGLVQSRVEVEHSGDVGHVIERGPTIEELWQRWTEQGRVHGELTRR